MAFGVGAVVSVTTRSMERTAERCAMAIAGSSKWGSIVWGVYPLGPEQTVLSICVVYIFGLKE